jgi:hypothetical protein
VASRLAQKFGRTARSELMIAIAGSGPSSTAAAAG